MRTTKITAVSDLHGYWPTFGNVEPDDILILGGDLSKYGKQEEFMKIAEDLDSSGFDPSNVIIIGGNHDAWLEHSPKDARSLFLRFNYLEDERVTIQDIKFYGSPVTPMFCNWHFMHTSDQIGYKWDMIPEDIDILITHGPAYGHRDKVFMNKDNSKNLGCPILADKIANIKPRHHVFGHIHGGHGLSQNDDTSFHNVSIMDESYSPTNPITIFNYVHKEDNNE